MDSGANNKSSVIQQFDETTRSVHFTKPGRYFSGIRPESKVFNTTQKQKPMRFRSWWKDPLGTDKTQLIRPLSAYISPLSSSIHPWTNNSNDQLKSEALQSSKIIDSKLNAAGASKSNSGETVQNSMFQSFKNKQQSKFNKRNKMKRQSNILKRTITNPIKISKKTKKEISQANSSGPILISSDEDDVVVIPLPPSFPINIDSSSDETQDKEIKSYETNERNYSKTLNTRHSNNSSRCTSPASVFSDDFIQQNDRSRLLKESEMPDDADLILIQETVHKDQLNNTVETIPEQNFVTPNKVQRKRKPDFVVTQSNFKAIDVYESESDMIESSVYSKGSNRTVKGTVKPYMTRRLSTPSNSKQTNFLDDSTDSENEFPCIVRGEAVERGKDSVRNPFSRGNSSFTQSKNLTDNDFINLISTITEAKTDDDNESDTIANDITAREIAENVINKCHKKSRKEQTQEQDKDLINETEVLPNDVLSELSVVFEKIDNMAKSSEKLSSKTCITVQKPEEPNKEENIEYDGTLYHVVDDRTSDEKLKSEIGWNEEMYRFYNQSWNGENFNVYELQSKMDPKANWKICPEDRFPKKKKNLHMKCINCCEYGHTKARCTQPKKIPVCYMCGNKGHLESRCPNSLCLRCGKKTNSFKRSCESCRPFNIRMCLLCKMRGHTIDRCPDKWRRYHSTTNPFAKHLINRHEWNSRKYCCICAQKGHISDNCRHASRFLDYPPVLSNIQSYAPIYDSYKVPPKHTDNYRLHCNPENKFQFKFSNNMKNMVQPNCYTRFLKAVGLDNNNVESQINYITQKSRNDGSKKRKIQKANHKSECESVAAELNQNINNSTTDDSNKIIMLDESESDKHIPNREEAFKIPEQVSSERGPISENLSEPLIVDSDSNYSFSEHFGSPEAPCKTINPEMTPLLDFIPLSSTNNTENDFSEDTGNHSKEREENTFIMEDDSENEANDETLNNKPSEAKIFLTNIHIKYLLSPEGNKFLVENSAKHKLKTSIELTPHGHILIIQGLPTNQDNFHSDLVTKFKSLNEKIRQDSCERYQHIPKKTEVLIRFLREHLAQLETNLGQPNYHLTRLKYYEKLNTKSAFKLSEKIRRLLNMILFGQAGLENGKMHLEQYQNDFRKLLDCKEDFVPNELREQLKNHWQYIFSCGSHENYDDLVTIYNNLKSKNEGTNVAIDPLLLELNFTKKQSGQIDASKQTTITNVKNMSNTKTSSELNNTKNLKENTPKSQQLSLILNPAAIIGKRTFRQVSSEISEPSGSQFPEKAIITEVSMEKQDLSTPINKPDSLTQSNGSPNSKENLLREHPKSSNILKKRSKTIKENNLFWSKESIKFLDEFWNTHSNPRLLDSFKRVREKAVKGLLSFNDYRAIIKLYNSIKNIKKKKL